DFDKPDYGSSGVAWKATTWNRKLSWCAWRDGHTVDVAEISVDTNRYSALLPELLNDETKQLELKNLIFINPTLSIQDDHLLYIRAKVKAQDDTSWVLALDMKHASLNALAPVSTQPFCGVSVTPCTLHAPSPSTTSTTCQQTWPNQWSGMYTSQQIKDLAGGSNGYSTPIALDGIRWHGLSKLEATSELQFLNSCFCIAGTLTSLSS
uniref:DUF1618 domain-containing protein n=1 Tax=Aegilops tauschii subsp. strangulata TaxID=200361 RepID=A0A453DW75_AEGTS